ncbi:MAG TPA: hypothetical protein VFJ07_18030 [Streptosporangiaceae bacterium]|nr:hypothetical protein [Streptosporangiaceae bacterium]
MRMGSAHLLASCAAMLTVALGATTARAATTWTIAPGGAITAKSGRAAIADPKIGKLMTCTSLTARGTLKSGSGIPGSGAGSLSAFGFHQCTDPLAKALRSGRRLVFEMTATGLPWHLNLSSADQGVVTGTISHMRIGMVTTQCTAVIDGTGATARDGHVRFRYAGATGRLTVLTPGSGLRLFDVHGCFGLLHDGDPVTISATFTVTPKQAITSP